MRVIVNYKSGERRIITADDIDTYKDHVEVYPVCCEYEPQGIITIYKKEVRSMYECYDWFGEQRKERIL